MTPTTLATNAPTGNCLRQRLATVESRIEQACTRAKRRRADIQLLPVSKTISVERLREAHELGLNRFGENYLQEALSKIEQLPKSIEWHFIGPIQSNKTRAIAENFSWAHSLDRAKIARRLSEQRPDNLPALNVCVQININEEASKAGIAPAQLPELVDTVRNLDKLKLCGFMCLPLATDDTQQQCASFRQMRQLRDKWLPDAPILSMGMSADMEAAIAEGSTMIRIGSALFGPRPNTNDAQHDSG